MTGTHTALRGSTAALGQPRARRDVLTGPELERLTAPDGRAAHRRLDAAARRLRPVRDDGPPEVGATVIGDEQLGRLITDQGDGTTDDGERVALVLGHLQRLVQLVGERVPLGLRPRAAASRAAIVRRCSMIAARIGRAEIRKIETQPHTTKIKPWIRKPWSFRCRSSTVASRHETENAIAIATTARQQLTDQRRARVIDGPEPITAPDRVAGLHDSLESARPAAPLSASSSL